jgi:sugar lactone lactonase YvrE
VALIALLALCFGAPACAQGQIVVSGTPVQLGALTGGGWDGSQEPVGGTFVVGLNGNVLVGDGYTSNFLQITPSGSDTTLASGVGASNAALDSYGNLYFGGNYNANVYKIPYNAATGQYVGWTTTPTANCLGGNQDTAACVFAPAVSAYMSGTLAGSGNSGYAGVVFDAQGNFFFESNTLPGTNPNTIFECNVACISNPSATPTLIYADKNPIGALAIDPWGNLFFVDGNNSTGKVTNLNELPLSSGSYASSATLLESYTNKAGYGNGITGLAISGTGTVYFSVNGDGIFAFPNTRSGGPNVSGIYMVSTQGGKGIALDSNGNLYGIPYNSGDVVSFIPVGSLPLGAEPVGTAATAVQATVFDSAAACTPTLTISVTESGVSTSEFGATAGATCSTAYGGSNGTFSVGPVTAAAFSSFPVTLNFTPTAAGLRRAALTIADSTNSASGTAALTGVGQSAVGNVDPGVTSAITTGLTSPASVVSDPAGDLFIADSGAGKVYEIASGSSTLTSIGAGLVTPDALAFDANGDLFIADDGVPAVEEILNTGTAGAFVAGTQSTVVSATTVFGGAALSSATGLAFAPNGTLNISDTANKRVVFWNPITGQSGVTLATTANGIKSPMGLAVDSSGNLYVADSNLNQVLEFASAGGITAITAPNVSDAVGVAVDASGSLLVADAGTGNIVWIPNVSGTLTTSKAVLIETVSPQASSLWIDSQGDAYVASASGKAAYAIKRTAAAINLGTVQDGVTNSGTVNLMNAGNQAATLGSPDVTQSANTMFALAPAASNGCSSASSGPPGASCQFTATFAPPVTTPPTTGLEAGTASINIATPTLALSVNMSGTATQSAILAQTITFTPPASLEAGQQITLSATGGLSGNPVTFSIDPASACPACATIAGSTLAAVAAGAVKVDANQAAGTANGNQYAAAQQVQASITINNNVVPTGVPALLMNQTNWLLALPSGGAYGGTGAGGSTFVVNPAGNPVVGTSYGNAVELYNLNTGAWTKLGSVGSVAGLAQDSAGDLYLGGSYSGTVAKLPYNSSTGTYATLTDPTSTAPPQCTGNDTTECAAVTTFPNYVGIGSMTVDASGNLFIATDDQGTYAPHAIFECSLACQTGASAPVLLFQETATSVTVGGTAYAVQYYIGGIGVDPWDNLFFTDSAVVTGGSGESATSHLYELAYTSGTGYAATPTAIQTFTNTKPGSYDDQLDAVAVTQNGTVYYGVGYDGIFGIPNTQAGPQVANQYGVVGQGPKEIAIDSNGNVYWVAYYNGGDTLGQALVSDLTTPNAQYQGAPVNASANVVDNAFSCGTAATIAIASSNSEFSATAGTTCSSLSVGSGNGTLSTPVSASSYPATITFTATKPGAQAATLTVADTTNGGVGTATVAGFALTTPQALTFTAPTTSTFTYSPGMTITLSVSNGGSNNPATFTIDSSSRGAGTISSTTVTGKTSSATLTVTQAGSILIDATEAGGLGTNGTYYDAAPQVQLPLTINPAPQVIVFPQPNSPVTYAANPNTTVPLSANGGASGNPVVFTVDTTSTGTGTVSTSTLANGTSTATLTVTGAGNIVIDANQASNTDYAAAVQVQQTIVVNQAAQAITFVPLTQPFHYIVTGATLSIQATGGASDQAITFTVDKSSTMTGSFSASTVSGAISTTTLTMPANQSPTSGTIVVDANQPGNTNYLAATQTQMTITVSAPLPTQTITFPLPQTQAGGTTLTLTATSSSGFPVVYSSSTASVCTVSGSVATFASVTSAGTCTITATQPGDNLYFAAALPVTVSFTVNPAGETPALNLSVSLPSLTIEPGTVGVTQITVTSQNNFTGSVAFSCSGLPAGYSCSFNPNPINLAEGGTTTTTLSVTPASSAALVHRSYMPLFPATLAVAFCFLGFRKRSRLQLLLLLAVLFTGLGLISACGGTSSKSTSTPVTSNITITATSGATQVSSKMTIILE